MKFTALVMIGIAAAADIKDQTADAPVTVNQGKIGHWELCQEHTDCALHGDYCC